MSDSVTPSLPRGASSTLPASNGDDEALTRRERERLQRRRAMLQAAQEVFAEKGYAHATLDEIAERAEFGKGTLYNYFEGGKESILFAIFDTIYGDLRALIRQTFSADQMRATSLRETFRALVQSAFDFLLKREALFFILVKEEVQFMFGDDPEKAAYFQEHKRGLVEAMVPALEAAVEAGEMRPLPVRSVAHMLEGNLKGILMHAAMDQNASLAQHGLACTSPPIDSPEKGADFLVAMLLDGLATGSAKG